MKSNTRDKYGVVLLTIAVIPMIIVVLLITIIMSRERALVKEKYNLTENDAKSIYVLFDKMMLLDSYTRENFSELRRLAEKTPEKLEDTVILQGLDKKVKDKYSFLAAEKNGEYIFVGDTTYKQLVEQTLVKGMKDSTTGCATYVENENKSFLYKRVTFTGLDGKVGNVFIITKMDVVLPHVKFLTTTFLIMIIVTILIISIAISGYAYYHIIKPIRELQVAINLIEEGNLDTEIKRNKKDEFGDLYQDVEKLRLCLKQSLEEQNKADKLTREVIGNISHDLKTPLTAIKGYAEGILDGLASTPERIDKYVRTIYTKAVDMTGLVDELAFFTKINQRDVLYSFTEVDVSRYFGDSVSELALDLELKGIHLIFQSYISKPVQMMIDVEKMKRVIGNIIGNAAKYIQHNQGIILVKLIDEGESILVRIEDNGAGIDEDELPYIFDRFYRTDSSRNSKTGGSGLGLAITKKIVEDHSGEIWAESKVGVGTAISFRLHKEKAQNKEDAQ